MCPVQFFEVGGILRDRLEEKVQIPWSFERLIVITNICYKGVWVQAFVFVAS